MKNVKMTICLMAVLFVATNAFGYYDYNASNPNRADGVWKINYFIPDYVRIDYFEPTYTGVIPNPGTTVEMLDGAYLGTAGDGTGPLVYNYGTFIMSGGKMDGSVRTYDHSSAIIHNGYDIGIAHSSQAVFSYDESTITIDGGYGAKNDGQRWMYAHDSSTMTIIGDFDSNYYGNLTNAPFSVWGYNVDGIGRWFGYISGKYANGAAFSLRYEIYDNAQIVLAPVPEPATISLLVIGGLALLKRRK